MGYCINNSTILKPSLNPNKTNKEENENNQNSQKYEDNMLEVLFEYEGQKIIIQSNIEDKIKDIIHKFKIKMKKIIIYIIYIMEIK